MTLVLQVQDGAWCAVVPGETAWPLEWKADDLLDMYELKYGNRPSHLPRCLGNRASIKKTINQSTVVVIPPPFYRVNGKAPVEEGYDATPNGVEGFNLAIEFGTSNKPDVLTVKTTGGTDWTGQAFGQGQADVDLKFLRRKR